MFLLGERVCSLTSQLKTGGCLGELSISMWFIGHTVGKVESESCWECIIAEEEKNLFPKSLMGTTIQDGGSRERKSPMTICNVMLTLSSQ